MTSVILSTTTRLLLPLLLLFSFFLLLRGHNDPGGGFEAGLIASAAFSLYALAYDTERAQESLYVNTRTLIALGLLLALTSAVLPLLGGEPLMTALWLEQELPVVHKIGTPLLFDIGVYLVVVGVTLTIVFTLAERDEELEAIEEEIGSWKQ
jgi:multicomponent Na+:H+ antiporter subunit B